MLGRRQELSPHLERLKPDALLVARRKQKSDIFAKTKHNKINNGYYNRNDHAF
jgi:hypothetical protein